MPKNAQNSSQKPPFSIMVQCGVPGAIYSPWHASRGLTAIEGLPGRVGGHSKATADVIVTLANSFYSALLVLTLDVHLEAFPDSVFDSIPIWMSSFQKVKEIKNPTVGSKVKTSGSVLT